MKYAHPRWRSGVGRRCGGLTGATATSRRGGLWAGLLCPGEDNLMKAQTGRVRECHARIGQNNAGFMIRARRRCMSKSCHFTFLSSCMNMYGKLSQEQYVFEACAAPCLP